MNSTPVPRTPSLEDLSDSDFMKLLTYAAAKIGTPFDSNETPVGSGKYAITVDALLKFTEFLEFKEAREHAVEAKKEAVSARRIAIVAIFISYFYRFPRSGTNGSEQGQSTRLR